MLKAETSSSAPIYPPVSGRGMTSVWGNSPTRRTFGGMMASNDEGPVVGNQPSIAEIAAAFKVLHQPEPQGFGKHVTAVVVAAAIGIGAWVLSGLNSVQTTLSRVDATMTTIQTTTQDTSRRVDALTADNANAKAERAALEQRIKALENRP